MLIFTSIYVYVNEMHLMKGYKVGLVARCEMANNPARIEQHKPLTQKVSPLVVLLLAAAWLSLDRSPFLR